jgi:hypothetical protein
MNQEVGVDNVGILVESFRQAGEVNGEGIALIVDDDMKAVTSTGSEIVVIGGNHTTSALKRFNVLHPHNEVWQLQRLRIIICDDSMATKTGNM